MRYLTFISFVCFFSMMLSSCALADSKISLGLDSNKHMTKFYIDGKKIGVGKIIDTSIDKTRSYEVIARVDGYREIGQIIRPPYNQPNYVSFHFDSGDRINPVPQKVSNTKSIVGLAQEACKARKLKGKVKNTQVDVGGGASIKAIRPGGELEGRYSSSKTEVEGDVRVPPEHQLEENSDYRKCVQNMTIELLGARNK